MSATTADRLKAAIAAAVESLNEQDARPKFSALTVITYTHANFTRRDVLAVRIAPVEDDYTPGGQAIKAPDVAVQVSCALAFEMARGIADLGEDGDEVLDGIEDASSLTVGFDYANDDGAILYFPNIPSTD